MLAASLFDGWRFERPVETDFDEIVVDYVSDDGGIDVLADHRDTVDTIFLYRTASGLSEAPTPEKVEP